MQQSWDPSPWAGGMRRGGLDRQTPGVTCTGHGQRHGGSPARWHRNPRLPASGTWSTRLSWLAWARSQQPSKPMRTPSTEGQGRRARPPLWAPQPAARTLPQTLGPNCLSLPLTSRNPPGSSSPKASSPSMLHALPPTALEPLGGAETEATATPPPLPRQIPLPQPTPNQPFAKHSQ